MRECKRVDEIRMHIITSVYVMLCTRVVVDVCEHFTRTHRCHRKLSSIITVRVVRVAVCCCVVVRIVHCVRHCVAAAAAAAVAVAV